MIVVSLTDCPPKVRGDLSKWLLEINTGVYVGNVNARVREELWKRICENVKDGRATMVYSTNGEQKLDFLVHNTSWVPVDFDGIKLIRKPSVKEREKNAENANTPDLPLSKASRFFQIQQIQKSRLRQQSSEEYIVLDLETTGLDPFKDHILEIAAIKIEGGQETSHYSSLIRDVMIPQSIQQLTGITEEMLQEEGHTMEQVLREVLEFMGKTRIVSHNAAFDMGFLRTECKRQGIKMFHNPVTDTLPLARRRISEVDDYKLLTLSKYFAFDINGVHRALMDCRLTHRLYEKLKEIGKEDED